MSFGGNDMGTQNLHRLGIDIGSTTVKIAILNQENEIIFADYERHFANIRETLSDLLSKAQDALGNIYLSPMITGSGGLTLAKHLEIPFVQEVIAVSAALQDYAPQTDVAIERHLCRRHRFFYRPDGVPASNRRHRIKYLR